MTLSTFPCKLCVREQILHFARREKHTMKSRNALSTLRVVAIAFGMLIAYGIPMSGQEALLQKEASAPKPAPAMNEVLRHNIEDWVRQGRGVPEDWSNHHLIFSNPGTEEDAIKNGTHDRWLKIVNDPRYILQQMKRSSGVKALADPETASLGQAKTESIKKEKTKEGMWTEPLIGGGQTQPNMWPGKFSFSTTVASCSADFVVYPTGVAGATGKAPNIIAYTDLYSGCAPATVPSVYWAYNTGGGTVTTSPIIAEGGSQVAFIQSSSATQSLTGCSVGFFELTDLTCTGGGLTSADVGAAVSGANIPAGDTIATVTGATTATLTTAATGFFFDATLTLTYPTANLVLLKWAADTGTLSAPHNLTAQTSASNYRNCTAPCYYAVSLGANDTYSAPFYDYLIDDAIYVGDDIGRLHRITGVFYGTTIAEASGWPVTLNASYKTASPVYDPTSGYVFVGDIATGTNAALYAVNSTTPTTINKSSGLGDAIVDGTLVDPNTEKVYAFVTTNSAGDNAVYQFAANFASDTAGTEEEVGYGGTGYYFYSGTFDNVYFSSATGEAGNLWVMGNTGGSTGGGGGGVNLYQIPINSSGAVSTPVAAISALTAVSQHVTEFATNSVNVTTASTTGSISLNLSALTASADNRLLVGISIVGITDTTPTVSSVTWHGTPLTSVCSIQESESTSNWVSMAIYELPNPSASSSTVAITLSGSTAFQAGAVVFTDVGSLGTCETAYTRGASDVSSTSVTVTAPGTGGVVFDTLAVESIQPSTSFFMTPTADQTTLWSLVDTSAPGGANCNSGPGTCTAGGTGSYAGNVSTVSYSFPGPSLSNTAFGAVPLIAKTGQAFYGWPSPVTEFCNNGTSECTASATATTAGTDYIFFSVDRLNPDNPPIGTCGTGAGDGCILGYNITTPTATPTAVGGEGVLTTNNPGCWSTSAIEIDNSVPAGTLAGASQIYTLEFNGNGAGGPTAGTYTSSACNNSDAAKPIALQLSQSALE